MNTFCLVFSVVGMTIGVWIVAGLISDKMYKISLAKQGRLKEAEEAEEVACDTCGVKLLEIRAKKVKFIGGLVGERHNYYCQTHAPKYDTKFHHTFYKTMEVDLNGEPIGYVKTSPPTAASSCTLVIPDDLITFTLTKEGEELKAKKPKGKCK